MISYLKGTVHHVHQGYVVVLVAGVGYEVEMPLRCVDSIIPQMDITLWCHQVVREDANDLYGFLSLDDRDTFRLMLKAHQVGPKLALSILDTFSSSHLALIGLKENSKELTRVKGMGPKLAHRLIIDLKSWAEKGMLSVADPTVEDTMLDSEDDALLALVHLGYKEAQVKKILSSLDNQMTTQERIRHALQLLSHRGV